MLSRAHHAPRLTHGTMTQYLSRLDAIALVVLQWPERLSKTSAEDLQDWLELIGRKIKRATEAPPSETDSDE